MLQSIKMKAATTIPNRRPTMSSAWCKIRVNLSRHTRRPPMGAYSALATILIVIIRSTWDIFKTRVWQWSSSSRCNLIKIISVMLDSLTWCNRHHPTTWATTKISSKSHDRQCAHIAAVEAFHLIMVVASIPVSSRYIRISSRMESICNSSSSTTVI